MSFIASYVALWFLAAFLTLVAIGLLRDVTDLRRSLVEAGFRREAPLVIGSRAPKFSAVDARSGGKITSEILDDRASLIVFISPHCSVCRRLAYSFRSLFARDSFFGVAVCNGDENDCRGFLDPLGPKASLLVDAQAEISELYGVSSYPVAVVVDAERRVRGYGYPSDARELEEFVANALLELNTNANSIQLAKK